MPRHVRSGFTEPLMWYRHVLCAAVFQQNNIIFCGHRFLSFGALNLNMLKTSWYGDIHFYLLCKRSWSISRHNYNKWALKTVPCIIGHDTQHLTASSLSTKLVHGYTRMLASMQLRPCIVLWFYAVHWPWRFNDACCSSCSAGQRCAVQISCVMERVRVMAVMIAINDEYCTVNVASIWWSTFYMWSTNYIIELSTSTLDMYM